VPVEDELKHTSDMAHFFCDEWRLPVDVRITTRLEEAIALAQRNLQRLGQHEQRLPAWLGPPRFDEAHMASRESRVHREIELAHAASGPPFTEQLPDGAAELVVMRGGAC
jgi:hypothetical protein